MSEHEIISKKTDSIIIEEVYDPKSGGIYFITYDGKEIETTTEIVVDYQTYVPIRSDFITNEFVKLPSSYNEYGTIDQLLAEIKEYLQKYCEYPKQFVDLDPFFVLHTWLYDRYPITPYRRALGDYGTGKTRYLEVIGNICYRPIRASGAASESSLFRMINKYKGTLIIDEADYVQSSLFATVIKILNQGYRKGTPIFRNRYNDHDYEPEGFDVFCPKIIGSRKPYKDTALESRFITHETYTKTRDDIPEILTNEFEEDAIKLRNKLLFFRLKNVNQPYDFNEEIRKLNFEPRLKEIFLPLTTLMKQTDIKKTIELMQNIQNDITRERGLELSKIILEKILVMRRTGSELSIKLLAESVRKELDYDEDELTNRKVGAIIKKDLLLKTKRARVGNNSSYVIIWSPHKIQRLCNKYSLEFNDLTSLTCSKETSSSPGTPKMSNCTDISYSSSNNSTNNTEETKD